MTWFFLDCMSYHISSLLQAKFDLISPLPFDNGHDLTGQLESIDSAHVAQDAHENVPIGHGDDVNVVVSTLVVASF